jgi:two-component system, NarL family, sensor histidine kinase UhpB
MEKTLRILIIEDSEDDTLLLMRHLRRDGYSPLHKRVDSMEEVETALNTQTWDIVISDYVLPHFSGLEALRLVQKKDPDLPCIIVSGRITDETAVAAMKSGARDYIMKDSLKRIGVAIERELAETEARRERKRAQEQLREVSEKLYLVTETIQDAFWMSSPVDGGIAYLSPAFEDIWGRSRIQIQRLPQGLLETVHTEDRPQFLDSCKKHAEGKSYVVEYRILRPDGEVHWIYDRGYPIYNDAGQVVMMTGVARDITPQKLAEGNLRSAESSLRNMANRLVRLQEEERRNIARELHDQVGQSLTGLKLMINQAMRSPGESANSVLNEAQSTVTELIQQVREMSLTLRPSMLDDLGLLPTLLWHLGRYTTQTGIKVNFEHHGLQGTFSPDVSTAAYRIIQEALTNVARYAKVDEVSVQISVEDEEIRLVVEDHGCGFDMAQLSTKEAAGISGMRERAQLLGGSLTIKTGPGTGTTLTAKLPLNKVKVN